MKEAFVASGWQDVGAFSKEEKPLGGINKFNVIKVGRRVHWKHVELKL